MRINAAFTDAQVNAVFEAMEQEHDAIILNSPELTSFSGQRANAQFIRQVAYISDYAVDDAFLDPEISVLNVGDIIDVRPLVSADRKYVTLEVRPTTVVLQNIFTERIRAVAPVTQGIATVVSFPIELPNVELRTMRTTVLLPDKGSLLLGGYVRGLRQRTHSGVPFLSHIPFLGRLFSKNGIYDENRHLMFLVTVNIIDVEEMQKLQ
jgi:type II secretory pathway component GspD/PulD (secretin)